MGDVGRPDLLEKVAGAEGSAEAAARALFHSLRRLQGQPDSPRIWPGHGAGSACGKGIGVRPSSTLGSERMANWALQHQEEDAFVRAVLEGQPEPPRYFGRMKWINREGPPVLGGLPRPPRAEADQLEEVLKKGDPVVDTRPATAFAAGHVPGSVNIPLGPSFPTWAASLLPYDRDLYLIVEGAAAVEDAVRDLTTVGMDAVAGYFGREALSTWARGGKELARIAQITAPELIRRLDSGRVTVVDVRTPAEWDAGHLPGARNLPLGSLPDRLDELGRDEPLVVHCQSGARSAIAASLLRARGLTDVTNLADGFADWQTSGLPVERPAARRDSEGN